MIKNSLELLSIMTGREIKARYKRAVFGFLWVVLNPLLQMLIMGLVFSFFIKIPNYFLFLFIGLLPWQFFSLALNKATTSFVSQRSLIQKSKFPLLVIPLSIILADFFHLLISFSLLLIFMFLTGRLVFPSFLLIIPIFLWLLLFTFGLSLLMATMQVRYRDVSFFIQTLLTLWFYATPILYNLALIPVKIRPIFNLNPLTAILGVLHFSLLGQEIINLKMIGISLLITTVIGISGMLIYKKQSKYFVDWL